MLLAIIMAVMGLIVLFNPFGTASMLVSFVGVVLILNAAVDLWDIFYISNGMHNSIYQQHRRTDIANQPHYGT